MVGAVEGAGHAAVLVMAEPVGQMLKQRSAAGDVDQLHAAADPEHGQIQLDRPPHERDFEGVALERPFRRSRHAPAAP